MSMTTGGKVNLSKTNFNGRNSLKLTTKKSRNKRKALVKCSHCSAHVRKDRLARHMSQVHHTTTKHYGRDVGIATVERILGGNISSFDFGDQRKTNTGRPDKLFMEARTQPCRFCSGRAMPGSDLCSTHLF
jgi:hypothetical protein